MRKILVVARTEIAQVVRTRAFLVGVLLMPVLAALVGFLQQRLENRVDGSPRRFAVVDRSGDGLWAALSQRADARNAAGGVPRFDPVRVEAGGRSPVELRLELSDRVRRGELFAFVELPTGLVGAHPGEAEAVRYYSDTPTYDDLSRWIREAVGAEIRERRYRAAGIDLRLVSELERPLPSETLGLVVRTADGTIAPARKVDVISSTVIPIILMFLLFMPVLISTPQHLSAVIEEKMSRISEVLLGSLSPFELMMGKLLGGAGVSLMLAGLYLLGGFAVASFSGMASLIPGPLIAFYLPFLVLAVILYGSIYIAIGAACVELKDAQSLMTPVVLLTFLPLMSFMAVVRAPQSPLAVALSLFPPSTPFILFLRLGLHPAPPVWQVALGMVLCAASAVGCVAAAGRIFRLGLLAQGKTASFAQMLRWVLTK
jgi:ABC-type Na+ efflux pump permease subunit